MNMAAFGLQMAWFDLFVLVVVVVGIWSGRKHGFSTELLPLVQTVGAVIFCGMAYRQPGMALANWTRIQPNLAFVVVYCLLVVIFFAATNWLRGMLGQKVVGKDTFGNMEYYLGMVAGAARHFCFIVMLTALWNARYVTPEELAGSAALQRETLGSITLPTASSIHEDILVHSLTGRQIRSRFPALLIATSPPVSYEEKKIEGMGRRMEKAIDEDLGTTDKK